MAGSFSDNWEAAILNHFFKGTVYNQPAHLYVGLFTVAPTDAGGGTEVTIGSAAKSTVSSTISYRVDRGQRKRDEEILLLLEAA